MAIYEKPNAKSEVQVKSVNPLSSLLNEIRLNNEKCCAFTNMQLDTAFPGCVLGNYYALREALFPLFSLIELCHGG